MAASTPHQRLHVRGLLTDLEMNALHVTPELMPFAERSGISTIASGERIDDVLRKATSDQARALAKALLCPAGEPA